ncbi:MAG: terminase small subunit [bacterium]|nr:terminase small subunit [bacterium]
MTEKQKRFCDEYLIDLNATRAYKVAYPNVKKDETAKASASRMLTNVNVKSYIDKKLKEISDKKTATAKEVIEYLTSIMRGEVKEDCLRMDGDGVQVIDKIETPIRERTKAAELLGKRYGLFTDKMQVEGNIPVMIVDDLEDDVDD